MKNTCMHSSYIGTVSKQCISRVALGNFTCGSIRQFSFNLASLFTQSNFDREILLVFKNEKTKRTKTTGKYTEKKITKIKLELDYTHCSARNLVEIKFLNYAMHP